jgi:NAD(P)-dependent dehydrogenase (short-subunit alcohol dehydrogenase family)
LPRRDESGQAERRCAIAAEDQDAVRALMQTVPMRRGADPDEISSGVLFLASDEASFVTGSTLVMDGGQLAV